MSRTYLFEFLNFLQKTQRKNVGIQLNLSDLFLIQ
jgi:hypothetical protein